MLLVRKFVPLGVIGVTVTSLSLATLWILSSIANGSAAAALFAADLVLPELQTFFVSSSPSVEGILVRIKLLSFRLGGLAIFSTRWNRFLTSGCFVAAVLSVVADLQGLVRLIILLLGIGN